MNDAETERGKTGPMSPTDNELMEDVRDGRVERLAVLFERYQIPLYNFFLRLTGNRAASEDLVQDVFMRVLKYRAGYLSESRFNVWLFQIARNAHVDHLRKHKATLPLDEQFAETPGREPLPGAAYESDREAELVRRALDRLPVQKREVLVLFRYQNLKLREIAELLGVQVGTVKAQVHRALKDLSRIYLDLQKGNVS
ncbi:MAG: sigma-70 family RNA polymerase sigma factor [Candidatus Aminicenantes bacterium]|jgi:RNA polymerase sigma-70 factor (ECF subfamily)|nr:sigma-70 family RNA polymerase sigma factor [Candidatus Aminicenantes bacterium]NLH75609.1 sigma-70 family RNA polymerase sigma factor [Acidobacteriota bacterium]